MFFPIFAILILSMFNQLHSHPIEPTLTADDNKNNDECALQHGNRLLKEAETLKINEKLFKVEKCRLERAYQTCSKQLWLMISVVCSAIDEQRKKTLPQRHRRFKGEELLTEACCDRACTVAEMTGFCFS